MLWCRVVLAVILVHRVNVIICIANKDKNTSMKTHVDTPKYQITGPRLNIKTVLSTYGDFHVKDKTAVRTSYL